MRQEAVRQEVAKFHNPWLARLSSGMLGVQLCGWKLTDAAAYPYYKVHCVALSNINGYTEFKRNKEIYQSDKNCQCTDNFILPNRPFNFVIIPTPCLQPCATQLSSPQQTSARWSPHFQYLRSSHGQVDQPLFLSRQAAQLQILCAAPQTRHTCPRQPRTTRFYTAHTTLPSHQTRPKWPSSVCNSVMATDTTSSASLRIGLKM
jgi:hypothetical protein